ncbi:MAG: S24/S26 family peptidase [Acidimicrobiia bacterium]
MRRFEVAEESMLPGLRPGDILLARRSDHPPPGSIVVFPHPNDRAMWLVKRLVAASEGEAWVESDNQDATLADSRTLGWIATGSMYRAWLRYRRPASVRLLIATTP